MSPSRLVVQSRLLSAPDDDKSAQDCFVPMIDLLNHHPYGSRCEVSAEAWSVRAHHPGGGDELFLRYNGYDALDVALTLGYAETATRYVASVACEVVVAEMGAVSVDGAGVSRRRLPTPTVTPSEAGLVLSGVQLEPSSLTSLVALLSLALRVRFPSLGPDAGESAATMVVDGIIEANREFFSELARLPYRDGDDGGPRRLLREVAAHQLHLLGTMGKREGAPAARPQR